MKIFRNICFAAMTVLFLLTDSAAAQLIEKKTVSLELAKKIAAAAESEAIKNKWNVVISIVDDGGNLVYLGRMDQTQSASVDVSIQKARCAMMFKRSTKVFEDMVVGGRNAILSLPGAIPIEGGILLMANDQIVGAIGVSGVKSSEDGIVAKAGADFLLNK